MAGVKFELPNEEIEIRYIKKQTGSITDPRHIAYGGMLEGAHYTYCVKKNRDGQYFNVLTNEEKAFFETALHLPENGLSVYNKGEKDYWATIRIRIGKEGLWLNLNDPIDYIKYKVLLQYTDIFCDHVDKIDQKKTYKFVVVRKDDEAKQISKKIDVTKEAYKFLGKLEDNKQAMIDFLRIANIKVSEDTSEKTLIALVGNELVKDPKKFVQTLQDPSYHTRVLIHKSMVNGDIVKKGTYYYTKEGEALAEPGTFSTIDNVVRYLENDLYQEYRLNLMAKNSK